VEKLPLFALVLASSVITFASRQKAGAVASTELLPLPSRVANALQAALGYLEKMVGSFHLAVFYPIPGPDTWGWPALAAGGVLAGQTCVALLLRRQQPYLLVGWLSSLGTLVPVAGLIQVGGQALADRYTEVPLLGLFIPGWRNGRLAIQLARQACQAFESPPPDFLDSLAAADAEAGRFEQAVGTAQEALRLATAGHQEALARQIEAKLRLFERHQPYHDEPVTASR
jgi:hypothetical protein